MKVTLELYCKTRIRDKQYPLVVRFTMNRQPVRYHTGLYFTIGSWEEEKRLGYPSSQEALKLLRKAENILKELIPFDPHRFREMMDKPWLNPESLIRWITLYVNLRKEMQADNTITKRTLDLDTSNQKKLEAFIVLNPEEDNVHQWNHAVLERYRSFLMTEKLSVTTARIYMQVLRTFFNWLSEEKEVIPSSPFRKYKLVKETNSWYPYSLQEIILFMSVTPVNNNEREAVRWMKILLLLGGVDPKDLCELKWKQVNQDSIQIVRTKVIKSSKAGRKIIYLTEEIKYLFTELTRKKEDSDYVLPVFNPSLTQQQNFMRHDGFIKKINKYMRRMINRYISGHPDTVPVYFTVKRLRPTAATLALMSSGGNVDFVSKLLMHSNLKQTSTYLANLPNDELKINQEKYNELLKKMLT